MKCVVLAGGFGTRLHPLTISRPKPMAPVINVPMLEHIVAKLKKFNITELYFLLYYQKDAIKNYFKDGSAFGVNITYVEADDDYGTCGAVKYALPNPDDDVLIISGDVLNDFNLKDILDFHYKKKSKLTIVLTRVENPLEFGIVITDKNDKIEKFMEKPTWSEVFSDTINTGTYIISKELFKHIPYKKNFDFSKDFFPKIMKNKISLYGYIAECYWKDIGNLKEYRLAHIDYLKGKISLEAKGVKKGNVILGKNCSVHESVKFTDNVILGDNVVINENCEIIESSIGDNTVIDRGTKIIKSVLWRNINVGSRCSLRETIVADNVVIGDKTVALENSVIADNVKIGRASQIKTNVKIWPFKEIEEGSILPQSLIWSDKWNKNIFGAYGVTGIGNYELTADFVTKLGAAYGSKIGKNKYIVCGRDNHGLSEVLNSSFLSGLRAAGVNVVRLSVVSLPVMRDYIVRSGSSGGIYFRQSPFEEELFDIKFISQNGTELQPKDQRAIESLFFKGDFEPVKFNQVGKSFRPLDYSDDYYCKILNGVDVDAIRKKGLKIVVDFVNGTASPILTEILNSIGLETVFLNSNMESKKLSKTHSEFKHALEKVGKIVKSLSYDLGFLIDAGGEKIFMVDKAGKVLSDSKNVFVMLYLYFASKNKKGVVLPANIEDEIEEYATAKKHSVYRSAHYIWSLMEWFENKNVGFICDGRGGYIFPSFSPYYDGIYSILFVINELSKLDIGPADIVKNYKKKYTVKKETIRCDFEKKGKVLRKLVEYAKTSKFKFDLLDGIKIFEKTGWVLLSPDPDKLYLHLFVNAKTKTSAEKLIKKYKGIVGGI